MFTSFSAGPDALPGRYRLARSGNNYDVTEEESGRKVATGSPGSPIVFAGISATIPASNAFTDLSLNVIPFEQAVDSVRKRINAVAIQKQADVVRLTCRDKTARGAFSLCSEIQREYLSLRAELQRGEAVAAANFLREQAERARLTLSAAEDDLQRYQEEHRALDLGDKARQAVILYGDLQARLQQLTGEHSALVAILGEVEEGQGNVDKYRRLASFPPFLQNKDNVVTELVASLVVLENKRSELGSRRTEANPELAAVIARISEIEGQILSSAQSYLQSLSAQIASAKQTLADQSVELATVPSQEVETARLQRKVGMLEEAYRFLQTRRQDAEVAEAVALPSVRTIDRPSLPYNATVAKVPLGVAIGTILGLFVGLLAALWREGTDRKIRHRKQIRAWGVPVLAMVPRVPRSLVVQSTRDVQRRLQRVVHDQSVVAGEAFRGLAFELESIANRVAEKGVRSIAITSAGYPEGKTFCAVNLAVQLVLMGKKPLLIDADVRAQGVTKRLGIPTDDFGFAEVVRLRRRPTRRDREDRAWRAGT